jgi:hypothetical protein|tara:strand:- start:9 stop:464 length:456 start_codon:yes stop_codon:yes gene_type:complete
MLSASKKIKTTPKPTFNQSNRLGECGERNEKVYIPLFRMGCCGSDANVLGYESFTIRPLDFAFFSDIAQFLKMNSRCDWDWSSFRRNILLPNREHIKQVNNWDDARVNTFLEDGYCFLNNFESDWDDDDDADGNFPNLKNLFDLTITKWEY